MYNERQVVHSAVTKKCCVTFVALRAHSLTLTDRSLVVWSCAVAPPRLTPQLLPAASLAVHVEHITPTPVSPTPHTSLTGYN
jgi:hypothetical protein